MPGRSKTCGLLLVQYRGTCPIAGVKSSHPFVPLGRVFFLLSKLLHAQANFSARVAIDGVKSCEIIKFGHI